jgi:hypothetical protein
MRILTVQRERRRSVANHHCVGDRASQRFYDAFFDCREARAEVEPRATIRSFFDVAVDAGLGRTKLAQNVDKCFYLKLLSVAAWIIMINNLIYL